MNYQDFLSTETVEHVLPYFGGGKVVNHQRSWKVRDHSLLAGWYRFRQSGRFVEPIEAIESNLYDWQARGLVGPFTGYQAIGRFYSDKIQAPLYSLPDDEDLERFTPVIVWQWFDGHLLFSHTDFETEVEIAVREAFDNEASIVDIKGVTPGLVNAYLFEVTERELARERQQRKQQALEKNALQQRVVAFESSLEGRIASALSHSNAQLIDWRRSGGNQLTVRYQVAGQRIQCIIDSETLQVIDSGICLEGADKQLNLSSLPSAVQEAIDSGELHIYQRG